MKKTRRYVTAWKGHQIDWDFVSTRSDLESCYHLTPQQIAILLSLTEYIGWKTRWFSPTHAPIEQDLIDTWQSGIERALMLPEECGCDDGVCNDYLPNSQIVTYAPNDPFQTPEYIPPGYVLPPWYTNPAVPLPGVLPSDAMVNFLSLTVIPIAALAEGMPRFRISVVGTGEVELEFVKVPQGGYVLLTTDNSPAAAKLIDLASVSVTDVVSLEALLSVLGLVTDYDIVQTEVIEIDFTTAGEHVIDCTFIPNIGSDVILGFGGGLRRVSLCGLSLGAGAGEMPQLRMNGCDLEWRPNSVSAWIVLGDLSTCTIPGPQGEQGPAGPQGPQGEQGEPGDCDCIPDPTVRCTVTRGLNDVYELYVQTVEKVIERAAALDTRQQIRDAVWVIWADLFGPLSDDDKLEALFFVDNLIDLEFAASGTLILMIQTPDLEVWSIVVPRARADFYYSLPDSGYLTGEAIIAFQDRLDNWDNAPDFLTHGNAYTTFRNCLNALLDALTGRFTGWLFDHAMMFPVSGCTYEDVGSTEYCARWSVTLDTLCGGWNWNAYAHGCNSSGAWGETFIYEGQTYFTFNTWKLVNLTTVTQIMVVLNEARALTIGTTTGNAVSSPSGTVHVWTGEYSIEGQLHILLDGAGASPYVQSITVWGNGIPDQFLGHECS